MERETLTTSSPWRKTSCWSSCRRLNLFSALPVSALTALRNSRIFPTTSGSVVLSGLSAGVCFRTASRSKGYRANRVVGFVRYPFSSSFRDSGRRSTSCGETNRDMQNNTNLRHEELAPPRTQRTPGLSSSPSRTRTCHTAGALHMTRTAQSAARHPAGCRRFARQWHTIFVACSARRAGGCSQL